jgi:hypothetical protein
MADTEAEPTVAERLGRLLDRGLLPAGGPAEAAERLIERLQRPARVALLGLPGSGKSAILNLLAGTVVVPETLRLPTMIVQHGDVPRMLCTLSDGRTEIVQGTNLEKSLTLSPALITLELDLPALRVISLLEVAAGSMEADQRRAALWAGKRADILIWCTTAYLPKEQLVWEGMPDAFKDNGFLLLTKVDLLGGREAASGMHHRVEQRASGEFRQVLSISAKEARAAHLDDGSVDRERFRESGAAAVISTIKSRVQMARRADEDTAELILARHGEALETPIRPSAETAPAAPVPEERPSAEYLAAEAAALERVAAAAAKVAATPPVEPVPAPKPVVAPVPTPIRAAEPTPAAPAPMPEPEPEAIQPESAIAKDPSPESVFAAMRLTAETPVPDPEPPADLEPDDEEPVVQPTPIALESSAPEDIVVDDPPPPAEEVAVVLPAEAPIIEVPETLAPEVAHVAKKDTAPVPPVEVEAEVAERESPETSARFTARLKQIPLPGDASSGLVPLRATWKSRTDASDLMPIEPKPTPNKNLTPRQRPADPNSEARLVGKISRPGDSVGQAGTRASSGENGSEQPKDAGAVASPSESPATPSGSMAEAERRATKPTSVFGSRPRPEPPKPAVEAPVADDLFPPLPEPEAAPPLGVEKETAFTATSEETALTAPVEEAPPAIEPEPVVDVIELAVVSVPVEVLAPEPEPEPDVQPLAPEPPKQSLADRLGVPGAGSIRRDIPNAVRVSRIPGAAQPDRFTARPATLRPADTSPMPSPQDIVAPRVTISRVAREEGASTERRERPRIAPRVQPAEPAAPTALQELPAAEKLLLDQAVTLIVARSTELADQIDPDERLPVDLILENCRETAEQVQTLLNRGGTTHMRRISTSLGEVQDLIMLMQLERGHAPADDALTLILQLRRELETLRAV